MSELPESMAARAGYSGIPDVPALIGDCASGRELAAIGFGDDVAVAVEIDSSAAVPVLSGGSFADAAGRPLPAGVRFRAAEENSTAPDQSW
ncbi:hypothetical protein [Nocardia sp. NPDC046763]|uniref:hypothetical protein n=1 Tax=Nocardia sp. NPDC046763 TaxID=3155256 RepID=UPI0033EB55B8